jgi:hypothetical protein
MSLLQSKIVFGITAGESFPNRADPGMIPNGSIQGDSA